MSRIKNHKYTIAIISLLAVCFVCILTITYTVKAEENTAKSELNGLMKRINSEIQKQDVKMLSGNPYDYIDGSQEYIDITNRGVSAIPELMEVIGTSNENGLKEYIAAIAIEEITNTQLNKDVYKWSNGKGWLEQWNIYLRSIPLKVNYIVTDTENDVVQKKEALKDIGVMALPYIQDAIAQGYDEFEDIYNEMLSENHLNTMQRSGNNDIAVLRSVVEAVRVD